MSDQVDVAVEEAADPVDVAPIITPRRLLRWSAIVGAAIFAVLACWQDPLYAHAGVRPTVPGGVAPTGSAPGTVLLAGVVGLLFVGTTVSLLRRRHH